MAHTFLQSTTAVLRLAPLLACRRHHLLYLGLLFRGTVLQLERLPRFEQEGTLEFVRSTFFI